MARQRLRNMRWSKLNWVFGVTALYACSFQNFDYLNEGSGGKISASGGVGTGKGGSGGAGASSGGSATTRGGSGGGEPFAGASGESGASGTGGEVVVGRGGAPAAGGVGSGGKASGGGGGAVGAGGSGQGGSSAGRGGTASGGASGGGAPNPTLVNPSFESALTGWTVDPADAGPSGKRYVYTQAPTDSSKPPQGSQELATWSDKDSYQVSISQTVRGLRDGVYTFKGYFSSDRSGGTFIFARNCGGANRELQVPTTSWTWFTYAITNVEVLGGSCEVGIRVIGAPNDYLNADMFTFEMNPDGAGGAGGAGGG